MKDQPFKIAKDVLSLVAKYKTPPTPKVYAAWYRYVEGDDEQLREQLDHAVDRGGDVDAASLVELFEQFCTDFDVQAIDFGPTAVGELEAAMSLLDHQRDSCRDWEQTLVKTEATLRVEPSDAELRDCGGSLREGTAEMHRRIEHTIEGLERSRDEIETLRSELANSHRRAMTDPLTGLGNRRRFDLLLRNQSNHPNEDQTAYLAVINIDRLKDVNRSHGFDAGDRLVKFAGKQIAVMYPDAGVCRIGGDEFALFTSHATHCDAVAACDRIRNAVSTHKIALCENGPPVVLSLSIGAARHHVDDKQTDWLDRSRQFLDQAKRLGRNRSIVERGGNNAPRTTTPRADATTTASQSTPSPTPIAAPAGTR